MWIVNVPGKIAICIRRGCHELEPTRYRLRTRGELSCLLYPHAFASLGHVLCPCPIARTILEAAPFNLNTTFTPFNFREWLYVFHELLSMSLTVSTMYL